MGLYEYVNSRTTVAADPRGRKKLFKFRGDFTDNSNPEHGPSEMPPTLGPVQQGDGGPTGTEEPDTADTYANCAGTSCGVRELINWPFAYHAFQANEKKSAVENFENATKFIPKGCRRVSCEGITPNSTHCDKGCDLELIVWLWCSEITKQVFDNSPISFQPGWVTKTVGYSVNFHMMGRDPRALPSGWCSKKGGSVRIKWINDPSGTFQAHYPTEFKGTSKDTRKMLCFCCDRKQVIDKFEDA